jgi:NAD(P)-dependent dehydrogenase (short-subunit alcohol dehydrogenase family)|tara:strand:- start:2930 stop:3802 length:873 start_codon:yes stop_codon:yes gene_type:complete
MRLKDKTAIITGAASGIGRETVNVFLNEGANVVLADINKDSLEITKNELKKQYPNKNFLTVLCDVSSEDDIKNLIRITKDNFKRLDVIFNNAGLGGAFGPITHTDSEDWDKSFGLLLRSVFLGIKHAAKEMQTTGGSIISTASIAGMGAGSGPAAYSAAKAGVINLTETTAVELGEFNIRVNSISPGVISTPLLQSVLSDERESNEALLDQPLKAKGAPEDIANTALFLASDESKFITGINICVDGGLSLDRTGLMKQAAIEYEKLDLGPVKGLNMGSSGEESTVIPIDD